MWDEIESNLKIVSNYKLDRFHFDNRRLIIYRIRLFDKRFVFNLCVRDNESSIFAGNCLILIKMTFF